VARTAGLVLLHRQGAIEQFEFAQGLNLNHRTHFGIDHLERLGFGSVYLMVDLL
jgi:hypothetical protein